MTATLTPGTQAQPASAELPGGDLRRMAEAVLPHAAREACEAALCAVQWEIRGGVLWLAATDTHTIGAARWPLPDGTTGDAGPVLVSVSESAALARFAGTGQVSVTIEAGAPAVTVTRSDGNTCCAGWPLPVPVPAPGDMPDWRGVLCGLLDGTAGPPASRVTFGSAHLPRFRMRSARAASVSGGWPAQLRFQLRRHLHTRALLFLVTCEDWFIGAIRPAVTSSQDGDTAADAMIRDWPGWLTAGRGQD